MCTATWHMTGSTPLTLPARLSNEPYIGRFVIKHAHKPLTTSQSRTSPQYNRNTGYARIAFTQLNIATSQHIQRHTPTQHKKFPMRKNPDLPFSTQPCAHKNRNQPGHQTSKRHNDNLSWVNATTPSLSPLPLSMAQMSVQPASFNSCTMHAPTVPPMAAVHRNTVHPLAISSIPIPSVVPHKRTKSPSPCSIMHSTPAMPKNRAHPRHSDFSTNTKFLHDRPHAGTSTRPLPFDTTVIIQQPTWL